MRNTLPVLLLLLTPDATAARDAADAPSPSPAPSARPADALAAADALLTKGEYAQAADAYAALLGDARLFPQPLLGLVRCRIATGRYDEAETLLGDVPADKPASAGLALVRAERAALRGRYEEAHALAAEAIKLDPELCPARLLLARMNEVRGRQDAALEEYAWFNRLVTTRLPRDAENLTAAGLGFYRYSVLTRHENLAQRTRHVLNRMFQEALRELDPTYWPAHVAAADLLAEKYNVDQATEEYEAALKINPALPIAHVGLGRLALEDWEFDKVEERVEKALAVNPHFPPAFHLRAACRLTERRYDDVIAAAEAALAVNPNDVEALALRAAAELALGQEDAAGATIARAEQVNPGAWFCTLLSRIRSAPGGSSPMRKSTITRRSPATPRPPVRTSSWA